MVRTLMLCLLRPWESKLIWLSLRHSSANKKQMLVCCMLICWFLYAAGAGDKEDYLRLQQRHLCFVDPKCKVALSPSVEYYTIRGMNPELWQK